MAKGRTGERHLKRTVFQISWVRIHRARDNSKFDLFKLLALDSRPLR